MTSPVYLTQPNIARLPQLLTEIRNGEIRIPRFQRPFVWTDEQRLLLLQSIYQGMPIGGILVWRTKEQDLKSYPRIGHLRLQGELGQESSSDEVKQYLLDGHQRLTTLYTALGEGLEPDQAKGKEPSADGTADDQEPDDRDWTIYFDLEEKIFALHTKKSEEPPRTWLPLSILFNPFKLYQFQKRLLDQGVPEQLIHRAESLASTFKDYSIPVVPIVTEDLELVTESFQRINSAGTDMDQVHMVSALTWSQDFDLNERLGEIREDLGQVGWQDLEEKIILNTCKAALGLDVYRSEVKAIQKSLQEDPDVLDRVTRYLLEASRFLRDRCKVFGPATLPYSFQVILLADAIRHGTEELSRPVSEDLAESLKRWFWITTYTEYFASINSTRLRLELERLKGIATQGGDPMPPNLPSTKVRAIRRFDFRAARSRALALRLAERSGNPETTLRLLAEHGRDATPMLVPSRKVKNRSLAEEPANRIVIEPRELSGLRKTLQSEPKGVANEVLRTHAIGAQAIEALSHQNWAGFIELRRMDLDTIEKEFVEDLGLEYFIE